MLLRFAMVKNELKTGVKAAKPSCRPSAISFTGLA